MKPQAPRSRRRRSVAAIIAVAVVFVVAFATAALGSPPAPAQDGALTPPANGMRRLETGWHRIVGATLHVDPERVIEDATLVVRDGRIAYAGRTPSAGADGELDWAEIGAAGAREWDGEGLHLWPAFLDAHVACSAPAPAEDAPGRHWNERVTPQRSALDGEGLDARTREELREQGFGAAVASPDSGVFRGSAALVSLAADPDDASQGEPPVYRERAYQAVAFETGGRRGGTPGMGTYPSSQMGAIALIRQVLADVAWRLETGRSESDALTPLSGPQGFVRCLFEGRNELESLRGAAIAAEFAVPALLLGSGTEFRRLDAIAATGLTVVLPVDFPEAPDVRSVGAAESVSLRELMTWEQAPTNPRRLDEAGVEVLLTTSGLRRRADFHGAVRKAIEHGLAPERALAMLTTQPAAVLGVAGRLGTLEAGKVANVLVTDGALFEEETRLVEVWIDGRRTELAPRAESALAGTWSVTLEPPVAEPVRFELASDSKLTVRAGESETKASDVRYADGRLSFVFDHEPFGEPGRFTLSGVLAADDLLRGHGRRADGTPFAWRAERTSREVPKRERGERGRGAGGPDGDDGDDADATADAGTEPDAVARGDTGPTPEAGAEVTENEGQVGGDPADALADADAGADDDADAPDDAEEGDDTGEGGDAEPDAEARRRAAASVPEELGLPFGAYMLPEPPSPEPWVELRGATIWTCADAGVIEEGSVVLAGGKIAYVGPLYDGDRPDGARTIDATGKHVTPGLIDCHSHTGISRGVNESGQAVTAEVRIGDVTDPDDEDWYRQLAGGLTAANCLHGSANAMGGQNQVVKLRWGSAAPADMHFEGAVPGIKFALGENVKQSNWGEDFNVRYPQSRMGVEALMRDRFEAAREYAAAWRAFEDGAGPRPRRDLELEALAEILAGERLIHCHSYRQDEILMLCRLAEEYGFTIGTFQHILEGYKVAEAIRENAIGASAFSDWWGYKLEVQDAIPYAGAIMHETGIVTSFNSDSNELARRMNLEAAKAVKWGGVPPAEALKFVTLNPAIQLAVDHRVGSLEVGKDADLAVWSGDPLSTFTRCERTFVDGAELFSLEKDAALREQNERERQRLVQKILGLEDGPRLAGRGRGARAGGVERGNTAARFEQVLQRERLWALLRAGVNLDEQACGDCGLSELSALRD